MTFNPGRFQSILVPLDGSSVAEQAIPVAAAIAERARCKVKLVLVHPPLLAIEPGSAYTKLELAMQKADRDYLRSVAAPLRTRLGRLLSTAVLQGFVVPTLARYARELGADLVVMTTHGRGGIRRAWLGSVTDQMIRTAEVPILVVRATDPKRTTSPLDVKEVLVPLDGSPLAEAALEPAAAFAALWDAEMSLVQIVHPVMLTSDPVLPFPSGYADEVTQIRREAAQDYIQDVAERLRESGVKVLGYSRPRGWNCGDPARSRAARPGQPHGSRDPRPRRHSPSRARKRSR